MIRKVSGCKGCDLPCINCQDEIIYTCDICGQDVDEVRDYDNEDICRDCFIEKWDKLEQRI